MKIRSHQVNAHTRMTLKCSYLENLCLGKGTSCRPHAVLFYLHEVTHRERAWLVIATGWRICLGVEKECMGCLNLVIGT